MDLHSGQLTDWADHLMYSSTHTGFFTCMRLTSYYSYTVNKGNLNEMLDCSGDYYEDQSFHFDGSLKLSESE